MQQKRSALFSSQSAGSEQAFVYPMPVSLTPLIGREREVAEICTLLQRPTVRLLTLVGTGGVGKTRLGLAVAQALRNDFADGTCFVSLAPVSDPARVLTTIAQNLGLWEVGDLPLEEQMQAVLHERRLLLLLDNFEQVVEAAPQLAPLLASCPHLKLLVTSRAALHLSGEQEFPVHPLALPDLTQLPEPPTLSQLAAVRLFVLQAQAIQPAFELAAVNARTIAEICVRLDGLPLAIELAAARIKLLPPQALLKRLSHRLEILTSGTRDLPTRQQTLRNTLQWSYDLLSVQEQHLFRWLSIFVGGCTLEAAEAVCQVIRADASQVLDGITSLLDQSLVQQIAQEGEEPRIVLLETVREFGLDCLRQQGELEAAHQAHALYYLTLAEETEPKQTGAERRWWLDLWQSEHQNLRAALAWLVEHEEWEAALRLGGAVSHFWWMRGYSSEGRVELARVLAGSQGVAAAIRAKALCAAGTLAALQGDYKPAEALCGESLALFRELGDRQGSALSLTTLGYTAWQLSDYAAARAQSGEAVTLYREVGNKIGIALALVHLGHVSLFQGEYDQARTLVEEAVMLSREVDDSWSITNALLILGVALICQGNLTQAQAPFEESLALARQEGYKEYIGYSLWISGQVALLQGDQATARVLLEESLALFRELGKRQYTAQSLSGLAVVSLFQGDYAAARTLLEESLALVQSVGNKWCIAECLVIFSALATAQGEWTRAARVSGAAEALCKAINGVLAPGVRVMQELAMTAARTQLGEEVFTAAWIEGRAMTPEQALAAQGPVTMPLKAPEGAAFVPYAAKAPTYPAGLTAREVEVLRLVAQGLTDVQVAGQLVISPRTVNWHLTSIYSKLGVNSRAGATRFASEHQLL